MSRCDSIGSPPRARMFTVVTLLAVLFAAKASAQGIFLSGVGPVNRAMGGASTAAPIDAAGALHWNPATISGLSSSELMFGIEMLLASSELSSTVPGIGSGSTDAEPGISPIPTVAWVHQTEGSPWTIGLGMYGIAGYRTNYPADPSNPILSPQPPNGVGVGRLFSEAEVLQITPTLSYAVTDRLSIGVAPTVSLARLAFDPLLVAPPVGDPPQYTSGRGTRYHWGGGVQAGVYYIGENCWNFGASIKSPTWFERFRFFTEDGDGGSRVAKFDIDLPMIVSVGTSYTGFENWLFALDVRYFNYGAVDGFGDSGGFAPTGEVAGLDWSSTVSVATGAQYRMTDRLYVRGGYVYQQNPIHSGDTFWNIASPLIFEHLVSTGVSYDLTCNVSLSAFYIWGVESSKTGPISSPLPPFDGGEVPGSSVTSKVSAHGGGFGVTVRY